MANNLTLSVTLTADGRQLTGTLRNAQGEVREFGGTTERESARAERALEGTGRQAQTVSGHLNRMRNIALGAATALVGMAGGLSLSRVISETAQFEDSILGLQAVTGSTVGQIAQLEAQARTLGATSMFSAKQAADAQRFLAQAGFDVNEVMAATPGVLNLAVAGQMDLAQAADIASNVLGGMRLEVDQLNRVNNVLAATSARSNTNISQLGEAFSYAGPFAASAGISIETTSAAIGVLSDAGLQASRAGTGLIGIIRQLSNVTPQAAGVLQNYGLSIEDVNIEAHGLETVLERIQAANISTADAFAIFGSEAGAAAQILAAGAGRVREFSGELNNVEGAVDRMAEIIGSGLTGSIRGFNSMLSESILQLGESGVSGAFQLVINNATGVLAVYNDMLPTLAEANNLTDQQVARIETLASGVDLLGDALVITTGIFAGRYVGALGAATTAKLGAIRQTILYQQALARMAGVSTTAAAGQMALAGATRAASGALALVGGPLGAAVVAAGAIYYFREELGLVPRPAITAAGAVDELAQRVDGAADSMLKFEVAAFTAELVSLQAAAQQAEENLARLERTASEPYSYGQGQQGDLTAGADRQRAQLESINNQINAREDAIAKLTGRIEQMNAADEESEDLQRQLQITVDGLTDSTEKAADKTYTLGDAYESLLDRITPNRTAARQYAQSLGVLNLALASGRITTMQYMQAMGLLQENFQAAQRETDNLANASDDAANRIASSFTTWGTVADNTIRRVDDSGKDLWLGLIDGSRNAMDTVKRGIQQSLAEIAHMLTTQRLTVAIAGSLGFNTGGAGGMGGVGSGGGFGINPGSINNAWQALQGGIGGIQWGGVGSASAYGGTGFANAATSGLGQTGFMGGSLRNFSGMQGLAGLGAGLAGNWLGGQLFGQGKHSSTLGTIGGAVGTYFGGPLGALAGSTLGSALGGIFGGSWKTQDAGLNLGVSAGDITGNQYENQRKSGGWFSSSKSRTRTSALNGELEAMLQDAYAAQEASLAVTLETLGQQSSALNAFSSGLTRISTKGLDEAEVEQAVQEWLQNVVNSAAQSVTDPSQYARAGETTVDTLSRLATALNGINPILEQLHENSLAASLAGGDAASHLAELAGGIDAFSARADYYYQNILTEAERQERAVTAAARAMGAFTARTGRVIESTDTLRDLVDSIDLTTASGRELYNEAMNLAPALVEIERGLERVGQQFEQMLANASAAVSDAESQVRQAWQTFDRQSFSQQIELLNLMGDAEGALALERERELATIDEALRPTQERIWAIQDEIAVQQSATQAARNYQNEVARVRDQLNQQLGNIGNWLDQQMATSGTPERNLATAQEQLARQLVLIENGDRTALQNITQYAQQVLEANKAYNASSAAGQRIQEDVYAAIRALPESISAEQFLADEIKTALREQTQGISTQLGDVLRGDNPSSIAGNLANYFETLAGGIDGVLTREQLAIVMNGKASDAQLTAILRAVDLNGDGVMSGLESVIIQSLPSDTVLGTVLRNKMNELDKNQLTSAQVRSALSPIATDNEIKRLIREIDVNGDGIISRQELGNARLSGLAGGIGAALKPMFDAIDLDTSGLIDWNEFYGAFNGLASDQELKRIFAKLDADGSGTISRLEALNRSNEGTEANTDSLEKQARDQLRELNGLVSEMARSTDQFVGLKTTMVSLRESINALGVAQAEIARIERERVAAEKAERDRIKRERENALRASSLEAEAQQSLASFTEWQKQAQATVVGSSPSDILSQRRVNDLLNVLQRFAGSDQLLSGDEMQRAIAHSQGNEQWSQRDRAFFSRAARAAFHESQYHQQMQVAADVTGDTYSGSVDFGYLGAQQYLNSLPTTERARLYLERYPDLTREQAARYGQTYGPEWGEYHYNRWGKNEGRLFANGGWTGPGGKWDPAGIVHAGEFVVRSEVVKQPGVRGMLESLNSGQAVGSTPTPRAAPLPSYPLLGTSDIVETLRDLKREVAELRRDNVRLQGESNQHLAAANNQRGAAATQQIAATERGNRMLKKLEDDKRLEAAKQ